MRPKRSLVVAVTLALVVALLPPGHLARASVFTVTNLNDSGTGSLRQAIIDANIPTGPDTIDFDIEGCEDSTCIIQPLSALPSLTDDGTTIDGTTQLDATVVINGETLGPASGFQIVSTDNVIKGLRIEKFEGHGVEIDGLDATGNTLSGNDIRDNDRHGVFVGGGQAHTIGGDTAAERNLISGNGWSGIFISGPGPAGNTVSGNDIVDNDQYGVYIFSGAQNNTIGGDTAAKRNLILGNELSGILISGTDSMTNTVRGNYVGTDGTDYNGNVENGVHIESAPNNTIGPDNVISGNKLNGVFISGCSATGNTVSGNYVGTDASGTAKVGNTYHGIMIAEGAQNNTVGPDNVISGNERRGVDISGSGTMTNTVSGNCIGTDASCTGDLGNVWAGVYIGSDAQNNTVGPGNVIAHSGLYGVGVFGASSTGNTITQNSIHSNSGLGIHLGGAGANGNIPPPTVDTANGSLITGTAGKYDTVEIFTGPDDEGKTYLTTTTAVIGTWSASGSFALEYFVTATATDSAGNTSEFSEELCFLCHHAYVPLVLRNY